MAAAAAPSHMPEVEDHAQIIAQLRETVDGHIRVHRVDSALFLADKLVTLSSSLEDVLRLARCYLLKRQHRRCVHLLRECGVASSVLSDAARQAPRDVEVWMTARGLAARALCESALWKEALEVLSEKVTDLPPALHSPRMDQLEAVLCVLRGRVFLATENNQEAATWYIRACKLDPFATEALERLVDNHMLTAAQESALLEAVCFDGADWLRDLYVVKLTKVAGRADEPAPLVRSQPLCDNVDVAVSRALDLCNSAAYAEAYEVTRVVMERDPYHVQGVVAHIAALVHLKKKSELYYVVHKLVENAAGSALAWYGMGCYHLLVNQKDDARQQFTKATVVDMRFAPAWIALGNTFAELVDESDQAMAAYRRASRLFPGYHIPLQCIGIEQVRASNATMAKQYLEQALAICPTDAQTLCELGVVAFDEGDYELAMFHLQRAIELAENHNRVVLEASHFNLGHVYRRTGMLDKAAACFDAAIALKPNNASTLTALALTYHMQGRLEKAITMYHSALALNPDNTMTIGLLSKALELSRIVSTAEPDA